MKQSKRGQEWHWLTSLRNKRYEQWVSFEFSCFQWPSTLFNSVQDMDMNLFYAILHFKVKKKKKRPNKHAVPCMSMIVCLEYRWHFFGKLKGFWIWTSARFCGRERNKGELVTGDTTNIVHCLKSKPLKPATVLRSAMHIHLMENVCLGALTKYWDSTVVCRLLPY